MLLHINGEFIIGKSMSSLLLKSFALNPPLLSISRCKGFGFLYRFVWIWVLLKVFLISNFLCFDEPKLLIFLWVWMGNSTIQDGEILCFAAIARGRGLELRHSNRSLNFLRIHDILYFETNRSIPLLVDHVLKVFISPVVRHEINQTMFYRNLLHLL